ncbi:MAG: hypothetical protein ACFFD2_04550 [Promethearchaeota archaeon]
MFLLTGATSAEDTGFRLEEYVKNITADMNQINVKFTNLVDLAEKLETDKALKTYLILKLDDMIKNLSEAASRQFNLSTYKIVTEILKDLKAEMKNKLIERIEKELFSIKTELGVFQKVQGIAEDQFSGIQQSITNIQQRYQDQIKSIRLESENIGGILPKIDSLSKNLTQNYDETQKEIKNKLSNIQQSSLQLLNILREEVLAFEKDMQSQQEKLKEERKELQIELDEASEKVVVLDQETKLSYKEIRRMKDEHRKMKAELENVSKELEKVTVEFEHMAKEKDKKIDTSAALALIMTLLVEVFGAQPHSKLLFLLHGQKPEIDRTSLIKASGIGGAIVRKALADLAASKLVEYNVESGMVKLLRRIY